MAKSGKWYFISSVSFYQFSYSSLKTRQSTTNQQLVLSHNIKLPVSITTADAKFGIMVDARAMSKASSFFFIYQSFQDSRQIYQPPIRGQLTPGIESLAQFVTHPHQLEGGGGGERLQPGSSVSIAIADAKFGINVGIAAISSTSSFFFIWYFLYKLCE
jgi:hypothetical protein